MGRPKQIAYCLLSWTVALLACRIGLPPPPTPAPFPIDGVAQLTEGYTHYQTLKWSPDSRYIAATRCLLQNSEPFCTIESQAVLINTEAGEPSAIDLSSWTANWTISSAVSWSKDGSELLLLVRESPSADPVAYEDARPYYLLYSPGTSTFREFAPAAEGISWGRNAVIIDWGRSETELLVERADSTDQIVVGWLSLDDAQFQLETGVPRSIAYLYSTTVFSTDSNMIVAGDSIYVAQCEDILGYRIGTADSFFTFIPQACFPAYSNDGSKLAYVAKVVPEAWPTRLMIADADGANPAPLFVEELSKIITYPTWSPDGSRIAFTYPGEAGANSVYVAEVPEDMRP